MSMRILFIFSMILSLIACDNSDVNIVEKATSEMSTSNLIVNEAGYEFSLEWPTELSKQGIQPQIKYNETSGVLEITGGKKIQIEVSDESMDLEEIKEELQGNQMFSYNFYEESKDGYIFQAVLPNGSTYFYNFLQHKAIGSKTYLFKNKDNEEFTLKDIKQMKEIAASAK